MKKPISLYAGVLWIFFGLAMVLWGAYGNSYLVSHLEERTVYLIWFVTGGIMAMLGAFLFAYGLIREKQLAKKI